MSALYFTPKVVGKKSDKNRKWAEFQMQNSACAPLCCKNMCCASRFCMGGGGAEAADPSNVQGPVKQNASPGEQSEAPRPRWKPGQQQNTGPENQDSQHMLEQPRGHSPENCRHLPAVFLRVPWSTWPLMLKGPWDTVGSTPAIFVPQNLYKRQVEDAVEPPSVFLSSWTCIHCAKGIFSFFSRQKGFCVIPGLSKRCFRQTVSLLGWHPPFSSFSPIPGVWEAISLFLWAECTIMNLPIFVKTTCFR